MISRFFVDGLFMQGAYHMSLDNASIIVDYNRQQLMPGWIPRRLGEYKCTCSFKGSKDLDKPEFSIFSFTNIFSKHDPTIMMKDLKHTE